MKTKFFGKLYGKKIYMMTKEEIPDSAWDRVLESVEDHFKLKYEKDLMLQELEFCEKYGVRFKK